MAEERGLLVDIEGFKVAMNEARERSRSAQHKVRIFMNYVIYFRLLNSRRQKGREERGPLFEVHKLQYCNEALLFPFYASFAIYAELLSLQQAGGTILLDADATAALNKSGVVTTDDSFKFTWFQVCEIVYLSILWVQVELVFFIKANRIGAYSVELWQLIIMSLPCYFKFNFCYAR